MEAPKRDDTQDELYHNTKRLIMALNELDDTNFVLDELENKRLNEAQMMLKESKADLQRGNNAASDMKLVNSNLVDEGQVFTKLEVAENSFDAILHFNQDMKILAMNAYQMQELLSYSAEENDLIIDWLARLDACTVTNYEDMVYFENLSQSKQS